VGLADGRPENVRVDKPDCSAVEPPVFDEHENLVVFGLTRPRQGISRSATLDRQSAHVPASAASMPSELLLRKAGHDELVLEKLTH